MPRRGRRWTHCLAALALAGCVDLARPGHRRARPAAAASQRTETASERTARQRLPHLSPGERGSAWPLAERLGRRYEVDGRLRVMTHRGVSRAARTLLPSRIVDAHRGSEGWVYALESGALFTSPTHLATPREIAPAPCAARNHEAVFHPSHGRLSVLDRDGVWRWSDGGASGVVTLEGASSVAWSGTRGAAVVRRRTLWFTDDGGERWRPVPLEGEEAGWVSGRADGLFVLTDFGWRRIADDGTSVTPVNDRTFEAETRPLRSGTVLPDDVNQDGYEVARASPCTASSILKAQPAQRRERHPLVLAVPMSGVNGGLSVRLSGAPLPASVDRAFVWGDVRSVGHERGASGAGSVCDLTLRAADAMGPFTLQVRGRHEPCDGLVGAAPELVSVSRTGLVFRSLVAPDDPRSYRAVYHWQGRAGARVPLLTDRTVYAWDATATPLSDGTTLLAAQSRARLGAACDDFEIACSHSSLWLVEVRLIGREGELLARRAVFLDDPPAGVGEVDGLSGVVIKDRADGALTLLLVTGGERRFGSMDTSSAPRICGARSARRATLYVEADTAYNLAHFEGEYIAHPVDPSLWSFELDPSGDEPGLCLRYGVASCHVTDDRLSIARLPLWIHARDGRLEATVDTGAQLIPVPIRVAASPSP
jgi:hypothetical protein